jgi:RNA polymerase sigma-54 factor
MKVSLQLKMSQSLTMTPQLQQAIKLLQLSTLELQQEIQEALDSNPLLELEDDSHHDSSGAGEQLQDLSAPKQDADNISASDDSKIQEEHIPEQMEVEADWSDSYDAGTQPATNYSGDDEFSFENNRTVSETLADHLLWQLNLTPFSDRDILIAETIIDSVDTNGYLASSIQYLFEGCAPMPEFADDPLEIDEMMAVKKRLQQFDPIGCCSEGPGDCLAAQLQNWPDTNPLKRIAIKLVTDHMQALATKDFNSIKRTLRIKEGVLKEILLALQSLTPRPGALISTEESDYIIPDVVVKKDEKSGHWQVSLNPEIAPKIRLNAGYASMAKSTKNSADSTFIKSHVQEAKWFIKSLQSRNDTLLKVSTKIVEMQYGFFEHGVEAMKPMVLADIADEVEMHESTISRVTTNKYMHTPGGIFELKYFFSSHVSTDTGGECSSTAIRAILKKIIDAEIKTKPLSDSKLSALLNDQGIKVARRTVAKYRESLNIASSSERKTLI